MTESDTAEFPTLEEARSAAVSRARKYKVSLSVKILYPSETHFMPFWGIGKPEDWPGPNEDESPVWVVSWTPPADVEHDDLLVHRKKQIVQHRQDTFVPNVTSNPVAVGQKGQSRTEPTPESDRVIRRERYRPSSDYEFADPESLDIVEDIDQDRIDMARSEAEGWLYSDDDPWDDKVNRNPWDEEV